MTISFPPAQYSKGFCQLLQQKQLQSTSSTTPPSPQKNLPTSPTPYHHISYLALNSLSLTSLPLYLTKELFFVQLSGHIGSIQPASLTTLWKKCCENEKVIYELIQGDVEGMRRITPTYHTSTIYSNTIFIELDNLLMKFGSSDEVNVMDIKMGTRTFCEDEIRNDVGRRDLFEKMSSLTPPSTFTPSELSTHSITKLRYMIFREAQSSTSTHGFRIEGIRTHKQVNTNMKHVQSEEDIVSILDGFLMSGEMRGELVGRLGRIREVLEGSQLFWGSEIIGSSLLIIHNNKKLDVYLIDFAKTFKLSTKLTHRLPWKPGNHEDGYLFGLDHLIRISEKLTTKSP